MSLLQFLLDNSNKSWCQGARNCVNMLEAGVCHAIKKGQNSLSSKKFMGSFVRQPPACAIGQIGPRVSCGIPVDSNLRRQKKDWYVVYGGRPGGAVAALCKVQSQTFSLEDWFMHYRGSKRQWGEDA